MQVSMVPFRCWSCGPCEELRHAEQPVESALGPVLGRFGNENRIFFYKHSIPPTLGYPGRLENTPVLSHPRTSFSR